MNAVLKKEIPDGWVWTTLGEAFKWGSGGTPKRTNPKYYGGDIPWLIIGDLNDGPVGDSETKITEEGLKNSSAKWVEPGSVLLAMYGSIGKLGIATERLTTNQAIAFTQAEPNDAKYLFYYLMFSRDALAREGKGATQLNISQTVIKAFPFPLAPLEQQKRIVAKIEELFSHIDAGIEALKKAKQLLKQYRQSVLKAAVTGELTKEWREGNGVSFDKTWQKLELGNVVEIIDPNPSHRYPPYDDGDVPLMATKQMVGEDDWDESTAKLTTSEFYEQRKASHGFKGDDIIFARKGRLGLARRPPKLARYAFSHTIFIMRGNEDIDSEYLLWFLRREEAISWMLREMNVAAGVPTLGKAILGKLPLLLPSKKEQKIIAEKIEEKITAIRRVTESIEHQLMKSDKNKQSILASAFSGEL
ncbi:MAG: restriction endonuclease subunit S [Pseudomonadales bacterium]|nr:restriction endonuclease subunit S [Pseudomonadales bacterium]